MIIGYIDEVGRGAIFGPLVVCMIICHDTDYLINIGVKDSKKLSPNKRESIYKLLTNNKEGLIQYSLGIISNRYIDKYGMSRSMSEACLRAFNKSILKPNQVLMDGNTNYLKGIKGIKTNTLIGGDNLIPQLGAASILAKVYRDSIIDLLSVKYEGYGLLKNKGYGTKEHMEGIIRLGPSKLHRLTFLSKYI